MKKSSMGINHFAVDIIAATCLMVTVIGALMLA
jgi:hypothetical protein